MQGIENPVNFITLLVHEINHAIHTILPFNFVSVSHSCGLRLFA